MDYVEYLNDGLAKDDGVEHADGYMYASVKELIDEHGDDAAMAAWNYACDGSMPLATAIAYTMERFKGLFDDIGDFACNMMSEIIDDAATGNGFGFDVTVSEHVNWDDVGEELTNSDNWYVITVDSGVLVWDTSGD